MKDKLYAFWLCNIPGMNNRKIERLLSCFESPKEIFSAGQKYLEQLTCLSQKDKERIFSGRNAETVIKQYEMLYNKGIRFAYRDEPDFPKKLLSIPDAPYGLFYKGKLPLENVLSVAIVGARKASLEAREVAGKFGRELAENGIQVISGMAYGVDISAQRGVMEVAGGRTYGILGTGVDLCYPRCHIGAYMQMQEYGGVISEFPLQTPPLPYHFPLRNRIISGLSDGILVIEAKKDSGSLITAETGLEQGKEIFVVPGSIMNAQYEGSNRLLQNGAALVQNVRDILDGFGLFFDEDVVGRKKKYENMLETTEKIVYSILRLEPVHISQIAEDTGLELQKVMEAVLSLHQKKLVQSIGNHYYAIKL